MAEPFGGYKRIQLPSGTEEEWKKYNPSCRPNEPIVVIKANGHACIKINETTSDKPYSELSLLWDADTAQELATQTKTNADTATTAAANASDSADKAKDYFEKSNSPALYLDSEGYLCARIVINTEEPK